VKAAASSHSIQHCKEHSVKQIRIFIMAAGMALIAFGSPLTAQDTLPKPAPSFTGKVDIDVRKSTPEWPEPVKAAQGAPNILLVLVDDVGFSTTSTFGGPVSTPNFERLAAAGLRYNAFHVNALCSPSRAALLSGRNAHEIGFGTVAEIGAGYPGYNTLWPKSSAPIAEVLKDNGYSTAAFGKWHNTPAWQVSPAGPFDRWPTGLGFEYYYGFMSGADNQYFPRIYRNTTPVEPPKTPEEGYHFTDDLTNEAIKWLHQHDAAAGDKPFFLYFATGATHSPHQVPKEWIEKYKGKFDQGWDALRDENFQREKQLGVIPVNAKDTPRPPGLPAWDSLSADEKRLVAHEAEVYAGYAAQTDFEIGRLLDAIKDEGKTDNTIVLWIFGDNGGSAQGGPLGEDARQVNGAAASLPDRLASEEDLGSEVFMNHFAAAWAWSLSAPFQGTKEDASHLGGSRDPLIISWPARIKQVGGLRSQFSHLNDIAPTLYEVAGITPPKSVNGVAQTPLEGTSLVYTFDHPNEPSRHHIQYFATSGNRAIYKDGWWAGDLVRYTWEQNGIAGAEAQMPVEYNLHPWELYNLNDDYSQANDLAAKYPEKLKEMQQLFDEEAKRNHVYPLLPAYGSLPSPQNLGKTTFVFRDGVDRLTNRVAPILGGHAYTLSADVDIPSSSTSGVIVAQGSRYGGFTLFVKDNHVVYEINAFGHRSGQIIASDPLGAGKSHIVVKLVPDAREQTPNNASFAVRRGRSATATMLINDKPEGTEHFASASGNSNETLDVGSDLGSPVSTEYQSPNRFTGKIDSVTIQLQ
jgi:arylsulfatase A-like enzyme